MKRFLMMMALIGLVGNWNSTLTAQLVSPDSLYLNEDLPEINIVAVKPLIKAEADKTTYSIAEDPDSRTYTLLEMLRKVPLVTVDGEDNVKVNGQSSFKIYMNGRPSNMFSNNPKEVLRSIPASMIKKVEVITDPGARYDAEGVSGILNIVTKGAEFEGYNASINTTVMNLFKSVGGFATLKYGRLSLSGNYTFSLQSSESESDYLRTQSGDGAKLIRRNSTSHATSEVKELGEGVWLPADLQPLVEYRHVQNIGSAYAGYGFKYGKWSLNPGIRMEHTWQDVTYKQGEGKDFNYRVTDWVPSWTSAFRLDDRNLFRLAYNLRLRRPNISYLNPTVFVSGTSISYGNPGLVSEKHHRLSASYSYYGTKLNVQASVLCTLGKGVIDEYLFIDSANVVNSTYDNLVDVKAAGGNLYLSYNPSPRTSVSLNSMLHYLDLRAQEGNEVYDTDVRNSGFCGSAFVDFSQKFKYGWRFVLSGGYVRSEPNVGMDSYGFYFYGLSVVKSFLKDKLTCTLRAQDFLGDHKTIQINERYPDFHIRQTERMFSRGFGIAISYRIGDLKASVKKAGRSIRNDDLLDAK